MSEIYYALETLPAACARLEGVTCHLSNVSALAHRPLPFDPNWMVVWFAAILQRTNREWIIQKSSANNVPVLTSD